MFSGFRLRRAYLHKVRFRKAQSRVSEDCFGRKRKDPFRQSGPGKRTWAARPLAALNGPLSLHAPASALGRNLIRIPAKLE